MNEYIKGLLGLGGGICSTECHSSYSCAVITHKFKQYNSAERSFGVVFSQQWNNRR